MNWLASYWRRHGTKVLGFFTIVVAGLPEIDGLVDPSSRKYWAAANVILGAMTVQRGVTNTRNNA